MSWDVGRLLTSSAGFLAERGAESARLDAELLLAAVLERSRLDLLLVHDMPVDDVQRGRYRQLIKRRAAGEPAAYLLRAREFHSLEFKVDARCLVPRPETEHLVDECLRLLGERGEDAEEPVRVVDLGTGSGCIVVSLAHGFAEADYHAVDVSAGALVLAKGNQERLAPNASVRFHEGDLFDALPEDLCFDLVVSNPPYVTDAEMEELPRTVREYEPALALRSGTDPIAFHRRIVDACVAGRLAVGGAVILELGESGATLLEAWLAAAHPEWRVRFIDDYRDIRRVAVVEGPA